MAADGATGRILTASPETRAASTGHDSTVIGGMQRRLYLTRVMRYVASIRITGALLTQPMHAPAGVSA